MFNQEMLNKAEAIRCIRVQALINEEFGFLDKNKQKADFLAYFRAKARERYEKWDCVCNHFEKFCIGKEDKPHNQQSGYQANHKAIQNSFSNAA